MKNIKKITTPLLISMLLPLLISTANAASPLWTFTPVSGYSPTATVPSGGSVLVKYILTNQSKKPHTLVMTPIANVTQVTTGSGVCANPVVLAGKQSCTLVLQVSGNASGSKVINEGPILCQQGGRFDCYQPSSSDRLRILNATRFVISISATPTTFTLQQNYNVAQTVTVTNLGKTTAQNIQATLPSNWTDVIQDASGCATVASGASCSLLFTAGSSTHASASIPIQGTNTKSVNISMSVVTGPALSFSQTNLALSVYKPSTNTALSGNSRTLTVSNTGATTATSVTYSEANNPSNAFLTVSPTSGTGCTSIASGASCTFTIAPGTTQTANNSPVVLSLSATDLSSNTNIYPANLYVLSYGSLYQTGYVYAIDDTTAANVSVGGTVAVTQLLGDYTLYWSPVISTTTNPATVNETAIYGVDETSTTTNASPSSSAISYSIDSVPSTACNGATDGYCNTGNIVSYFDSIGTPPSSYAAGLCVSYTSTDTNGTYSDWFQPAVCQLGSNGGFVGGTTTVSCPATQQSININLNSFICYAPPMSPSTSDCTGSQYIYYNTWSSTEVSTSPTSYAWEVYFNNNTGFNSALNGSATINSYKGYPGYNVLCSRAITPN